MTTKNFNQTATENQVNEMAAAFNPFGWRDLQAAVEHALNAGENADWAAEQVQEFAESCGTPLDKCDPVYCVMSRILQAARNEIDNLISFDIQNDASFDIYGNYMCSSWETPEDSKEALIEALAAGNVDIEDLETVTQYWLSENEITQDDINAIISKHLNAETN